jgi:hypothetical protein
MKKKIVRRLRLLRLSRRRTCPGWAHRPKDRHYVHAPINGQDISSSFISFSYRPRLLCCAWPEKKKKSRNLCTPGPWPPTCAHRRATHKSECWARTRLSTLRSYFPFLVTRPWLRQPQSGDRKVRPGPRNGKYIASLLHPSVSDFLFSIHDSRTHIMDADKQKIVAHALTVLYILDQS